MATSDAGAWIDTEVTYLERPIDPGGPPAAPRPGVHVLHAPRIPVRFYRFLYQAVGEEWHWFDRTWVADEELAQALHAPGVEVRVLYVDGAPAGYLELDLAHLPDAEVVYFGLLREYFGQGFGPWLLQEGLCRAAAAGARRAWLHTCPLDHPSALAVYQRVGFRVYQRRRERVRAHAKRA